jgi:hypothetical protein
VVPSDFLAVNEYSDLALAETNARTFPVAANGATRSALADATAPIKTSRSICMEISRFLRSRFCGRCTYCALRCALLTEPALTSRCYTSRESVLPTDAVFAAFSQPENETIKSCTPSQQTTVDLDEPTYSGSSLSVSSSMPSSPPPQASMMASIASGSSSPIKVMLRPPSAPLA